MKNYLRFAIVCLAVSSVAFAQNPEIGTPQWAAQHNPHQVERMAGPHVQQIGDDSLVTSYSNTACGLNYVMVSQRLGQRFVPIGIPQPASFVVNYSPCAVVQQAFLYTEALGVAPAIIANITNPASVTTAFNMTNIGNSVDVCWGMNGTHVWRTDVTSCITGPGTYTLSGLPTSTVASMSSVDCEGATLIIIYADPSANYTGTLKIDDGCHTVAGGSLNHNMTGFSACANSTFATDFMLVGDMQMTGYTLNMNGSAITQPQWNWWNEISSTTSVANGQSTCNYDLGSQGDCYTLAVAGLYFQTGCSTCTPTASPISLVTTSIPESCNGNGSASVSASGGSGNYTYLWSPGGSTSANPTGLSAGVYTVWVNDGSNCSSAQVTVGYTGMNLAMSSVNANCSGNGSATVAVTGGQAPYTYSWSPSGGTNATATNLLAGTYVVTVTDNGGCSMIDSAVVAPNSAFLAYPSTTPDTCSASVGTASVMVQGGNAPYTYLWAPGGQTTATITGQAAGSYTVTVTDNSGCSVPATCVILNPLPTVYSSTMGYVYCGDSVMLDAYGNMNGTYSWSPTTYLDNPNSQYPYSTSPVNITYTVTFTSACGTATDTFQVVVDTTNYFNQGICFVTVDTAINKNVVIWERWNSPSSGFYNIYRETITPGVYAIVGTQPISQFSTFTDMTSNPSSSPDRYVITTVNSCGVESDTSTHHRTIFMSSVANGPGWDLTWTAYEGLPIATYNIYRGPTIGTMTLLTSVPSSQLTYTDANPPLGVQYYMIEAVHPWGGCTPSMRLSNPQTLTANSAFSNAVRSNPNAINENAQLENSMLIVPNPGNGNFQLNMSLAHAQEIQITIFDNLGRSVYSRNENANSGSNSMVMNLASLSTGVYFVQVKTANGIATKRLVIN